MISIPVLKSYIPLWQGCDVIPLIALGQETCNSKETGLAVAAGAMGASNGVANGILAGHSGVQLRGGCETAGDDHPGEGAGGGGAEAACGMVGCLGQAQGRSDGGEARHGDGEVCERCLVVEYSMVFRRFSDASGLTSTRRGSCDRARIWASGCDIL